MNGVVIALAVVGALCIWLVASLLVAVPVGRWLRRRTAQAPGLKRTERGTWTAVLALGVLAAIALAIATRGQVITWDGVVAVPA